MDIPWSRLFRTGKLRTLAMGRAVVHACKPSTQEAEARRFWVQAKKKGPRGKRNQLTVLHYVVHRDFKTKHTLFLFGIVKRTLVDFMICIFIFIAYFLLTLGRRKKNLCFSTHTKKMAGMPYCTLKVLKYWFIKKIK